MTALVIASTASMIDQFNMSNIQILQELGYEVQVACNFRDGNTCSDEKVIELKNRLIEMNIVFYDIDFCRNVMNFSKDIEAYKQVKKLFENNKYELVHCHTPIGGVIARMAARKYRKQGTKVIYTAHGFHFYKGAPLKNWLLYFPVEWICSFFTDMLITINKEDFALAKKHMHVKHVTYIPGVGVDLKKFSSNTLTNEEKLTIRRSLGIKDNEKMLLSVGELIPRKDHETAIRAIHKLNDKRIKYFICGQGALHDHLQTLINDLGLSDNVKLLGFRTDISELCCCADLFVFPSRQEGLPVALMEAIASKTPVICSDIRGNTDLVGGDALFEPQNINQIAEKIKQYIISNNAAEVEKNYINLKKFDLEKVAGEMKSLYSISGGGNTS